MERKNRKKAGFWVSKDVSRFVSFASSIPSEVPVGNAAYYLLSPLNKLILDFGCFRGKSSAHILEMGAGKVVGIDIDRRNIEVAKKTYSREQRLTFHYVPIGSTIPHVEKFDGAAMVFVHPCISTLVELEDAISKISHVLKRGAFLVIVGFHHNVLLKRGNFLFYRLSPPVELKDSTVFHNKLILPSGKSIDLSDHYWSNNILRNILKKNNFSVCFFDVPKGLPESAKKMFNTTLTDTQKRYNIVNWLDEWNMPLYQIILAEKL